MADCSSSPTLNDEKNPLRLTQEETSGRFPQWLHRKLPQGGELWATRKTVSEKRLHTVCEEAKCPNLMECYSKKTATFLILGKTCTRNCGFCAIDFSKSPQAPSKNEPEQVAHSVQELGLKHVVITMVARDDLPDGGAEQLVHVIDAIRKKTPEVTIEVLTSDFEGKEDSLRQVLERNPDIFNHNLETVRSLTPKVRHKATYLRSLQVLTFIKKRILSK